MTDANTANIIEVLAKPIREQEGVDSVVYTAQCPEGCPRVYVGVDRPMYCGDHPETELTVHIAT